tara:strand:+ start:143 stop:364 length:222 start_codon:yes stop_codon:yes gene_type:complete
MLLLKIKVNYLKGHNLARFRKMDKDGSSLWRKMVWAKDKAKAVIKSDRLEKEYHCSYPYIMFCGDYDYGYVEK